MQADSGKTIIETDRMTIAENNFYLKGKAFTLHNHPPFRVIYQIRAPKIVVLSGRQVGKCGRQVGNVTVSLYNGAMKTLAELKPGDSVIALNNDLKTVSGLVVRTFENGVKPVVRITTRMGHVLEIATTHPVKIFDGYCEAGKLVKGDRVASMRKGGFFTGSCFYTKSEIKLLAYLIGDGCIGSGYITFTNNKSAVIKDFADAVAAVGGNYKVNTPPNKPTYVRCSYAQGTPVLELLKTTKLYGHKSGTKFVPSAIFNLDREGTALFLNRLWACDGYVRQINNSSYDISYCSISAELIKGVQALLWKFGIPTSIRTKVPTLYKGTDKVAYEMRVETQQGIRNFLTIVGALGKSEDINLPTAQSNNNRDTIPKEVQAIITRLHRAAVSEERIVGRGSSKKANLCISDYGLRTVLKYPPTPNKIRDYALFFDTVAKLGANCSKDIKTLYNLAESDIMWDEVELVEEIGNYACYDIEVAEYHNYVLNGVVTHNSTLLSTFTVSDAIGQGFWESLTVHPSLDQTRRFSNMRVAPLINQSPAIDKYYVDHHCRNNTHERSLKNNSVMYFGAMSQMDTLRGLSANSVNEDEIQDMVSDELTVVEEVMSGQHSSKRFIVRTGTAKTVGNILETTFRDSTMNEWIVPCSDVKCGVWNIPSAENIGKKGFICKRCKAVCNVREGKWRAMRDFEDANWVGFRIPQIILPTHTEDEGAWEIINHKFHTVDPTKFANEVMGHAAGSGITILDEDQLKACCSPDFDMVFDYMPDAARYYSVFATIDWGLTARSAFTVLGIWGVTPDMRLKLIMMKRYQENDPLKQVDDIAENCTKFAVDTIGADWGAGVVQSRLLEVKLNRLVNRFMYVSEQHELIKWDPRAELFKVNRTQAMSETFVKMRLKQYWFPTWAEFKPFARDILNIYEEPLDDRNSNDKIKYDHGDDSPDDAAHVCVYANLCLFMMLNNMKRPGGH